MHFRKEFEMFKFECNGCTIALTIGEGGNERRHGERII
jgi:hypothetical protein